MENTDWISITALVLAMLLLLRVFSLNRRVKDLESHLERIDSRSAMGGGIIKQVGAAQNKLFPGRFPLVGKALAVRVGRESQP